MDDIAVLIPCYNEDKTIEKVVSDFKRVLPDAIIYVYDNNSTDDTEKLAKKAGAVVRHEYQQGKGNVVRRMFQEIDAHCYILVDGDDTYPAESAAKMVKLVQEHNADMVVGDRLSSTYFEENKRPFHNIGNCLVRGMVSKLFHGSIRDIMTGYRAFSYRFVKTFPILSCRFEIETEMSIHAIDKRMQVETVVLLSKGEIDSKKVRVEFSLEDMDMSGFQKGATYEQIKAYVLEHTGLKVSSLYISQIKRKCGLDVGQNYNLSKKEDAKVPKCPPEKEAAIRDALKYFQMI